MVARSADTVRMTSSSRSANFAASSASPALVLCASSSASNFRTTAVRSSAAKPRSSTPSGNSHPNEPTNVRAASSCASAAATNFRSRPASWAMRSRVLAIVRWISRESLLFVLELEILGAFREHFELRQQHVARLLVGAQQRRKVRARHVVRIKTVQEADLVEKRRALWPWQHVALDAVGSRTVERQHLVEIRLQAVELALSRGPPHIEPVLGWRIVEHGRSRIDDAEML